MKPQNPEAFAGTAQEDVSSEDLKDAEAVEVSPAYFDEVAQDAEVIESSDEADIEEVDLSNSEQQAAYRADIKELFLNRIERIGLEFYKLSESDRNIRDLLVDSTDIHSRARETYRTLQEKLDFLAALSDQGADIPDELIQIISELGEKLYDLNDELVDNYGKLLKKKPNLENVFDRDDKEHNDVDEEGYSATEVSNLLDTESVDTIQPAPRASVMRSQLLAKLRGQGIGKKEANERVEELVSELNSIRDLRERSVRYHDVLQTISTGASETLGEETKSDAVDTTEEAEESVRFGYDTEVAEPEPESEEDLNTNLEGVTIGETPVSEASNEKDASKDGYEESLDVEKKESTILGESSLEEDIPEAKSEEEMPKEAEVVAAEAERKLKYEQMRREWGIAKKRSSEAEQVRNDALREYYESCREKSLLGRGAEYFKRFLSGMPREVEETEVAFRNAQRSYGHILEQVLTQRGEVGDQNRSFERGTEKTKTAFVRKFILRPRGELRSIEKDALLNEKQRAQIERTMSVLKKNKQLYRIGKVTAVGVAVGATGGVAAGVIAGAVTAGNIARSVLGGIAGAHVADRSYDKLVGTKRIDSAEAALTETEQKTIEHFTIDDIDTLERALDDAERTVDRRKQEKKMAIIFGALAGGGLANIDRLIDAVSDAPDVSEVAQMPAQPDVTYDVSEQAPAPALSQIKVESVEADLEFKPDNFEEKPTIETNAARSGLQAMLDGRDDVQPKEPGDLIQKIAEEMSVEEVVKERVSDDLKEAIGGEGEEGTVVVNETVETSSVPEPVTIKEGVAVPIAGENVIVDVDSITYQLAPGAEMTVDDVQARISEYLMQNHPQSPEDVTADSLKHILNDSYGTESISEPITSLELGTVTIDAIEVEAPEEVETIESLIPGEPDALSVAESEVLPPNEPEKATVVEPEKPEIVTPEMGETVARVSYELLPEQMSYTWQRGDNFWDLMEGQTEGEQIATMDHILPNQRQEFIDLVRDHLEANPELAKEVGFPVSGNLNIVYTGESVDLHKLDEVAMQVAIDNDLLNDSEFAPTESPRPMPRPEVTSEEAVDSSPRPMSRPEPIVEAESAEADTATALESEIAKSAEQQVVSEPVHTSDVRTVSEIEPVVEPDVINVLEPEVLTSVEPETVPIRSNSSIETVTASENEVVTAVVPPRAETVSYTTETSAVSVEEVTAPDIQSYETSLKTRFEAVTPLEPHQVAFIFDTPYEQLSVLVNNENLPYHAEEFWVTVTSSEGAEEGFFVPVSFVEQLKTLTETLRDEIPDLQERLNELARTLENGGVEEGLSLAMVFGALEEEGLVSIGSDGSVSLVTEGKAPQTIFNLK